MGQAPLTTWILAAALLAATMSPGSARAQGASDATLQAEALIRALASDTFAERERATQKLIEMGPDACVPVKKAIAETDDPEVRARCRTVLANLKLIEKRVVDLGPLLPSSAISATRSANGEGAAYLLQGGGKVRLFYNGKQVAEHDQITSCVLSADGRRFACIAKEGEKNFVVNNGTRGPDCERIIEWPRFSPDGKRLAYLVGRDAKVLLVCDGKEGPEYDRIEDLSFSPDSRRLICKAARVDRESAVVDGVEGPPHDRVWLIRSGGSSRYFVVDGNAVSLVEAELPLDAAGGVKPGGLVEKKIRSAGEVPADFPATGTPDMASGAELLFYRIARGGRAVTVFDGRELEGVYAWTHSKTGRQAAALARRDGKELIYLNGKELPAYDKVNWVVYSADEQHMAYRAVRDGKQFIVCDGKEQPPYESVECPCLSPDGRRLAYTARAGGVWSIICDGKPQPNPFGASGVLLSPDGERLVARGSRDGRSFVVVDGRKGPDYDWVGPCYFSRDGRHLRFEAKRAGRNFMVCDGVESPPHDRVWQTTFGYEDGRSFRYFAVDGGRETLVEVNWPAELDWSNGFGPPPPEAK